MNPKYLTKPANSGILGINYNSTFRLQVFLVFIVFCFLLISARLFYWQIIKGEELARNAQSQYQFGKVISAKRGEILASDNTWLVSRNQSFILWANPKEFNQNSRKTAERLVSILEKNNSDRISSKSEILDEIERIKSQLEKIDYYWVPIKNRINQKTKKEIELLNIKGLGFESEEVRFYPEASSSAHLLGFVGKNDKGANLGYFGLEGYFEDMLSGKKGYIEGDVGAGGDPIVFGSYKEVESKKGIDLITHIDKKIQIDVEEKLLKGIQKYSAKSGNVIIMNPENGGIIAMASFPSYDPANYFLYDNSLFLNPSISSSFEPGSIFKVLVMSSALNEGVVEPDTKCDICNGPYQIGKYFIKTWNNHYFENTSMTDVIIHSDNVGMTFVGRKLGSEKLYDYLKRFGIGELTGIDLQGESTPNIGKKGKWGEIETATISFGQGIAVTPIQMVRAVGAIANKGILLKPHVVRSIKGLDFEKDILNSKGERVISEKAASEITLMMSEAAKSGESKWTYKSGFGVAGKTGTAQIPIEGHYDEEKTIASFIGFAPYDKPKFVMLVMLREPQSSPWASETAAPLWYDIAQDLFLYYKIQPKF